MWLDSHSQPTYSAFMKRLLIFFFIAIAGIAGLVSVPRCYVLQPHCPNRGSFQCPYAAKVSPVATQDHAGGCCTMAKNIDRHDSPPILPGGKVAQFTIEQYLSFADLHIDPPMESVLAGVSPVVFRSISALQPGFSRGLILAHPPPLSVLLQKQSFLI
jgi:hypothetical protein